MSGKCPRVLVLRKVVNATQTFLLACDVAVVPLHNFSLIFVKLPLFSKIKLYSSFFIREKKNQSFLFGGICKSRLYSLDLSTDISILDSVLVHAY